MDALDPDQVAAACEGMDAVYYLIHGMGGDDFAETDRKAATNLADGARAHGVDRIVYLSGARSRRRRVRALRAHHVPPRGGADPQRRAGHRGRAARGGAPGQRVHLVRDHPAGQRTDARAHRAVVDGLHGAADRDRRRARGAGRRARVRRPLAPLRRGRSRPAALRRAARGLHRSTQGSNARRSQVPLLPTALVGTLVGSLTDVPRPTVEALVESLRHDMVVADDDFQEMLLPAGPPARGAGRGLPPLARAASRPRPRTRTRWVPCRRTRPGPAAVTTDPRSPRWSTRSRTSCRAPERPPAVHTISLAEARTTSGSRLKERPGPVSARGERVRRTIRADCSSHCLAERRVGTARLAEPADR